MQKNTGKMYHKRLVTHSFMEEPFLSSEIDLFPVLLFFINSTEYR